jgi:hypothetical protein
LIDSWRQDGNKMRAKSGTGKNPSAKELREAERVVNLSPLQRKTHPSAIPADTSKLAHINTYGSLPEYYVDQPFSCRKCGKWEIWKARDQKWYYEEARGHIDATAVECHDCRTKNKPRKKSP